MPDYHILDFFLFFFNSDSNLDLDLKFVIVLNSIYALQDSLESNSCFFLLYIYFVYEHMKRISLEAQGNRIQKQAFKSGHINKNLSNNLIEEPKV